MWAGPTPASWFSADDATSMKPVDVVAGVSCAFPAKLADRVAVPGPPVGVSSHVAWPALSVMPVQLAPPSWKATETPLTGTAGS
jgi:hypothetical protein